MPPSAWRRRRAGTAALEFALVAPIVTVLGVGVFDAARALIVWEQINYAAMAIALAAEKLSVSSDQLSASLTETQMQAAMSTIYAQMPGLNLGAGTGPFSGTYSVTLSSIVYLPLCQTTTASGCTAQTPYVAWSTSLAEPSGAPQLTKNVLRACGSGTNSSLTAVAQFPDDSTELTRMINPNLLTGATAMVVSPQLVADVSYTFTPLFSLFLKSTTFRASALAPVPVGDTTQEVAYNTTGATGLATQCALP